MARIIVVGGGAAGMMAAISAAELGAEVIIVEGNERLGRKLGITGKGRCNLTNNSDIDEFMRNIPRNARFLYSALSAFNAQDTMEYFEGLGVPLKTERGQRVFPVSDKAGDVVRALTGRIRELGIKVVRDRAAGLIIEDGSCTGVVCRKGQYSSEAVIVAAGGMSYPLTGSNGAGYELARQAGHSIVDPVPSLSALKTEQKWVSGAAGLNLRNIAMSLYDKQSGKRIYEDFGELLFTEDGISGPTVLSASAHIPAMERGRYAVKIDLKPALSEKQLDARILRDFSERRGKRFGESLRGLLPAELVGAAVELSDIPPEKKVDEITKEERKRFAALLKGLSLDIAGFRPIEEAIVTRGGVSVGEIS
ncbi:MAG: aminoacetone oxidase family FAD-binding enzyme, partial [Oscillospiraceae bacterium]|nr:aminoacetone oxidase family FAD-binding enzyme [Oscillospiraceae bacterium]